MNTRNIAEPDTHDIKREPGSSLPSSTSQDAYSTVTAQEPLLRGLVISATNASKSDTGSVTEQQSLSPRRKRKRIRRFTVFAGRAVNEWWPEIFCCLLSIACLAALTHFLEVYDGQRLPDWPSGITVNTIVALLSTVARTAFTVPVAEGLSQCKWNWFKQKPRPIQDFDLFDQASRGPWGSLNLLVRTKAWYAEFTTPISCCTSIGNTDKRLG